MTEDLVPGEVRTADGDVTINEGRETADVTVANTGDRPVQVGSHLHFVEANRALRFDRETAVGMRLNVPAGTAVRFEPDLDLVIVESGGDNLAATFNPELADFSLYVISVAEGDDIPRKRGPGVVDCDLLVVNKTDLAEYVGADLGTIERDARTVRDGPFVMTNCKTGEGTDRVLAQIHKGVLFA